MNIMTTPAAVATDAQASAALDFCRGIDLRLCGITLSDLVDAGKEVVESWESGDLAGAVNQLRTLLEIIEESPDVDDASDDGSASTATTQGPDSVAPAGPEDAPTSVRNRYVAHFTPQVWVSNNCLEADPQGPTAWDVTDAVLALPKPDRKEIHGGLWQGDEFLFASPSSPAWAVQWARMHPFCFRVEAYTAKEASMILGTWQRPWAGPEQNQPELYLRDSEGRYSRAYRDALQSVRLAMQAEGISPEAIYRTIQTAVDAYINNEDVAEKDAEIEEVLVASTAHLTDQERTVLASGDVQSFGTDLICSMQSEAGWLVYIPNEDVAERSYTEALEDYGDNLSVGFTGVLRKAIEKGVSYIRFDADGPKLEGVLSYK